MDRTGSALGALALVGGLSITIATGVGSRQLLTGATDPGADPVAVMAGCAAGVASLIAGWLTLCLLLILLAQVPGTVGAFADRVRDRVTPALVRQWAAVVLGASVTVTVLPGTSVAAVSEGPAAPAPGWHPTSTTTHVTVPTSAPPTATDPAPSPAGLPSPGWPTADPSTAATPAPGWTPSPPPARQQHDPHLLSGRHRAVDVDTSVVVRHGDSLWSIAATRLGPNATDGEIARAWPRWYAANTTEIGDDPHTLLPGMRLAPPTDHS